MAKKKNAPPIGFGRSAPPTDPFDEAPDPAEAPEEKKLMPPLAAPIPVGDMEMYQLFTRYDLQPLLPPSTFEYKLVEIIAGLEARILELAPLDLDL
jgi:hypothetical protein